MTALRLVTDAAIGDPDLDEFDRWQEHLRGLRPNTIRVRRDVLGRLSLALGKPLRDATEADLLRWEQVSVAGRKAETRRAYVSHVRAFYRWAVAAGIVTTNPATRLTIPKLHHPLPRPMPESELRQAVQQARPKMRLMILLGAFCGLRCIEIAGLHWSDLQTSPTGETVLLIREGKGGKERAVPVPAVVLEAMVAFGRRRSGPMFYGLNGGQMTAQSLSRIINQHLARCGVAATAHQLRHRYGTKTYQLTKDLRMVQELLGHTSPQTTARYAAYDQSQTVDMVRAMDEQWAAEAESLTER